MLTIYKYQVEISEYFTLSLPRGAKILDVQLQQGVPYIWVLLDPDESQTDRIFRLLGTGHPIDNLINDLLYVGTFQMRDGSLVFHLFEVN